MLVLLVLLLVVVVAAAVVAVVLAAQLIFAFLGTLKIVKSVVFSHFFDSRSNKHRECPRKPKTTVFTMFFGLW